MSENGAAISIQGVSKRFGKVEAVREMTSDIREGEFFTMLGPSGCGKTTTLRMIAGFEQPDDGTILLRGEDVANIPPNLRQAPDSHGYLREQPVVRLHRCVGIGRRSRRPASSSRRRPRERDPGGRRGTRRRKPNGSKRSGETCAS